MPGWILRVVGTVQVPLQASAALVSGPRVFRSAPIVQLQCRKYSEDRKNTSAVAESRRNDDGAVSTATAFEAVKENTRTAWYLGVILIGAGITGSILWTLFGELFSANSPNNIYSKSLDRCINDQRIQDHMGAPLKGYGEETRRGRRRHVSHSIFIRDGQKYMWMKFYIQGIRKKGTVMVEMKEDKNGQFQYNVLAVQMDDLLRTVVTLEDNRQVSGNQNAMLTPINDETDLSSA